MFIILIQTCVILFVAVSAIEDAPETKINQGVLRGKYQQTWKGKKFSAFTGIPYAQPPIGDLRFELAVAADPWSGIFDASKPHAVCPQIDIFFNNLTVNGNEDCLYLNVYTPQLRNFNQHTLPVMLFIHGGGWTCGSANPDLYGPDMLLDKEIILVTANYRLGALGFLSTENKVVPGNNGLKDQTLVLKWIKENIANFGGDPQKITVFGQSAGGASAHYHMLSPLSKDLISGVIAHSGTATATWALAPKGQSLKNAKKLAQFLNCPTDCFKKMVECLKTIDPYDIIEQDKKFMEWFYEPIIPFKPVIELNNENAFLANDPVDIIKSGSAANIPFMTGFTTEDGGMKAAAFYNDSNLIKELNNYFNRLSPLIFQYYETTINTDCVSNEIRNFYFKKGNIDESTKVQVTDMITDGMFMYSQNVAARLHATHSRSPVYSFVFGYRGSISLSPLYGDPLHDYGVSHGDDTNYLLSGDLFGDYKPTESDAQIIDVLTTLWANFAATGNPTPKTEPPMYPYWEPIESRNLTYYFIKDGNDIKMVENLYQERNDFWDRLPMDSRKCKVKDEL